MTAGIRSEFWGKIKYRCEECKKNSKFREVWGCKTKSRMSVPTFSDEQNGVINQYWNCPINFIPKNIGQFLFIYDYHDKFPGAQMPSLKNTSNRFLLAYRYYEQEYAKYLQMKD